MWDFKSMRIIGADADAGPKKWIELKSTAFIQTTSKSFDTMITVDSAEEARAFVEEKFATWLGYEVSEGKYTMVQKGTSCTAAPGFTVYLYVKADFFYDDFAGYYDHLNFSQLPPLGWARPGRGEGLGDWVKDLGVIKSVHPNDLKQGCLGDCWLISALSALAEYPGHVCAMVSPSSLAADGKYTVKLYDYQKQDTVDVVVDDRLPFSPQGLSLSGVPGVKDGIIIEVGHPVFAHFTEDGETWPCIVEKACAKLAGSYQALHGGSPAFAFGMLTGCMEQFELVMRFEQWKCKRPAYTANALRKNPIPTFTKFPDGDFAKDHDGVLKMLGEFAKQNYIMCAGTKGTMDSPLCGSVGSTGLIWAHAYTILNVEMNVAGRSLNMLQLRNPYGWGRECWKGDWSDQSDLWNRNLDVKKRLAFTAENDGVFWIEASDFFDNFGFLWICCKDMGDRRAPHVLTEVSRKRSEMLQASPASKSSSVSTLSKIVRARSRRVLKILDNVKNIAHGTRVHVEGMDSCAVVDNIAGHGPYAGMVRVRFSDGSALHVERQMLEIDWLREGLRGSFPALAICPWAYYFYRARGDRRLGNGGVFASTDFWICAGLSAFVIQRVVLTKEQRLFFLRRTLGQWQR